MRMVEWRPIPDFDGYEVSNTGLVRRSGRILHQHPCLRGYLRVTLRQRGKSKKIGVHRLVALAFLPNPQVKPQVNHKDGIHSNNRHENLEWVTGSENMTHWARELAKSFDHNHPRSKLSPGDVVYIRTIYAGGGVTLSSLSKKYSVSIHCIYAVVNHLTYSDERPNRKGLRRGESCHLSKLNEAKVKEILVASAFESKSALAKRFGVSKPTIASIIKRETWKHVKVEDAKP